MANALTKAAVKAVMQEINRQLTRLPSDTDRDEALDGLMCAIDMEYGMLTVKIIEDEEDEEDEEGEGEGDEDDE
jgi:hypothetical protein